MATFYDRAAQTAETLLTKFGAPATVRKATQGAYDPATGQAAQTTDDYAVVAAVFPVRQQWVNGTTILQDDKEAYINVPVGQPQIVTGDLFLWQGQTYTITPTTSALAPAGRTVLYQAMIRQ